jgi:hypothetical protein
MFFQNILDELSVSSLKTNAEHHPHFAILAAALVVLLVWRLLRFTIVPVFRPNEPKEYPYWIPGEATQSTSTRLSKSTNF